MFYLIVIDINIKSVMSYFRFLHFAILKIVYLKSTTCVKNDCWFLHDSYKLVN